MNFHFCPHILFEVLILIVGICDLQYQNKSDIVGATWHGFTDIESGIVQYLWCVDKGDQHCGIVPWTNVGMHSSVSTKLQHSVVNGNYGICEIFPQKSYSATH